MRTEIQWIRCHVAAGGIARSATDALDIGLNRLALAAHLGFKKSRCSGRRVLEGGTNLPILSPQRFEVDRKIANHRHIAQWFELDFGLIEISHQRPACPTAFAVNNHRARTAHPHTAGVTEAQRWVLAALDTI